MNQLNSQNSSEGKVSWSNNKGAQRAAGVLLSGYLLIGGGFCLENYECRKGMYTTVTDGVKKIGSMVVDRIKEIGADGVEGAFKGVVK